LCGKLYVPQDGAIFMNLKSSKFHHRVRKMEETLNLHLKLDQKSAFYTPKIKKEGGEK